MADGVFDLGITGRDWIAETSSDVASLGLLHYSKATARPVRIVVAVPHAASYEKVSDLPPGIRVSTEYPELTRRFFEDQGVDADIRLSYGATEAKVNGEQAANGTLHQIRLKPGQTSLLVTLPMEVRANLTPSRWVRFPQNSPASVLNLARTDQYSNGLNISISVSRSHMRRSATDCTRPAERLPGNFRQRTGDRVNPTR